MSHVCRHFCHRRKRIAPPVVRMASALISEKKPCSNAWVNHWWIHAWMLFDSKIWDAREKNEVKSSIPGPHICGDALDVKVKKQGWEKREWSCFICPCTHVCTFSLLDWWSRRNSAVLCCVAQAVCVEAKWQQPTKGKMCFQSASGTAWWCTCHCPCRCCHGTPPSVPTKIEHSSNYTTGETVWREFASPCYLRAALTLTKHTCFTLNFVLFHSVPDLADIFALVGTLHFDWLVETQQRTAIVALLALWIGTNHCVPLLPGTGTVHLRGSVLRQGHGYSRREWNKSR